MDIGLILTTLLAVAMALERLVELIKPFYLQIKNYFIRGTPYMECSINEKKIITILLGPVMCIVAQIGIDIPKVNEAALIQYILAGLVASLGSNVLHALLSIVVAFKNSAEDIKNKRM